MTLYELRGRGRVNKLGGDVDVHRRLADLGLLGAECEFRAKKGEAVLIRFSGGSCAFLAAVEKGTADTITID